ISFAAKTDFTTGGGPVGVAIGDVDGDGMSDIVVTNSNYWTMSVLKNTSTGGAISFAPKSDYATGSNPQGIALGDLDGDGKSDIVTANYSSNSISVFQNNSTCGTISLALPLSFSTGVNPGSVVIGDINADGKPDLTISNEGVGANTISVFSNTSTSGNISLASKVDFATGAFPVVSIGDLDGDGKPDLATACSGINAVSTLKNNGVGGSISFAAKTDFTTSTGPGFVSIGDLDGDGKADLVSANSSSNTISVLRNLISAYKTYNPQAICAGGSYSINGHTYTSAGTYRDTLLSHLGCDSIIITQLTVNPPPAVPTVGSNSSICSGLTLSLTASSSSGVSYNWTGPNNFTSTVQNPVIISASTLASGTYSVTASISGCPTSLAGTTTVLVNQSPASPVSSDTASCFGSSTPLLIAAPDSNIHWYNSSMTLVSTNDTFNTGLTAANAYTFYVTQTRAGCESPKKVVHLTIHFTPVPVAPNQSVTFGSPTPDLTATGTNVQWYNTSGTLIHSGSPFATGQTAIGTYSYYVTQTMNGCASNQDTVVLTIYPGAPNSSSQAVCQGQTIPDLTATGVNIKWYSDAGLATLVGTGSPFTTGQTAAGSYTYYVTQTVNNVQSPATQVILTIHPIPSAPVGGNQNACVGGIIPDLTVTGTNIQWYDLSGNLVHSGSSFATGNTAVGSYTYMATQSAFGCESPKDTLKLTINALPPAPVACKDSAVCYGNSLPDLTAVGTNIKWYNSSGTMVHAGTPYTTGITSPGVYTFYATQTSGSTGCESASDTVKLTINSTPLPIAPDVAVCLGSPVPSLTATGTGVQWYDQLGNVVGTGNSYNTGQTTAGTYTYYVTQTNSVTTCTSQKDTVHLIISIQATAAPVIADQVACEGTSIPNLTATTGTIINWYSNAGLTNIVHVGNPYATGLASAGSYTFFAADSTPGCPHGPSDTVMLTINPQPAKPVVHDTSICFGNTVPPFVFIGTNVQWYDASMSLVFSGDTFSSGVTTAGTYTYYVTQTAPVTGCKSVRDTIHLAINSLPAKPHALDTTVCSAAVIPNLTATGANDNWYNSSGILVGSGNSYHSGQTAVGTYTYYVVDLNFSTGCKSVADTSVLSILATPSVPVANSVAVCLGNPVPPLTATGTHVRWYSNSSLTILVHTGNTFATGHTTAGVYAYWLTDSLTNCVSGVTTVTLTINAAPVKPIANNVSICYGNPAVMTSTGTNPQWYTDATLINMVHAGNTYNTGLTSVGTYTYYVSDFPAGCGNSPSDTVVLAINPNPLITANTYSTVIVQGNSTVLSAYNATTYFWSPGGQTTASISVSPSVTTTYTVIGKNQYGCSGAVTILVVVNPLGIASIGDPIQDVSIYPNPAIDGFTLEFISIIETPVDIYMINTLGDRVLVLHNSNRYGQGLTKYQYYIDTGKFTEGVYDVEIITQQGRINKRVVLLR
ncbi:MAG TPA: FG-GAP-like repeat-containing protein, partial [Bacteroidia bacterium]